MSSKDKVEVSTGWPLHIRGTMAPSILGFAIWLYILDLLNLDVWCAERFVHTSTT